MANVEAHIQPDATTDTVLYTASGKETISTITVCNLAGADATYRIYVVPDGENVGTSFAMVYDATIEDNETYTYTIGVTPKKMTKVYVYASSATVSFALYGNSS